MIHFRSTFALLACLLTAAAPAQSPTPQQPASQNPFDTGSPAKPHTPAPQAPELKPYNEVVTDQAKSQAGVFKVHEIGDRILWEIPESMLGRDFLWQSEVAELPQQLGFIGRPMGTRVVRFERRDRKVFMRAPSFTMRAEGDAGIAKGVADSNVAPIIGSYNVLAEGPDHSVVIDVTAVFVGDQSELAVGPKLGAAGIDPARSYLDRVTAFPTNIETRAYLTLAIAPAATPSTTPGPHPTRIPSSATILVNSSLVLLPKTPMMGRLADSRVGYFTSDFDLFGSPKHRVETKEFIERYRLEKKDPKAAVSDPVRPIVFYLSREVPDVYRPYLKKAVESWQAAFEQAGFSHAIVAKDAPSVQEDPTWDPEDARYNVIRWLPSTVENAIGPHIVDPRSGETISAHVLIFHNVLKLAEDWYFTQASASDPRAAKLPLPDAVMGEAIQFIVTHEVGHTLGLTHNFKASSRYTIQQLRDPAFTKENGIAASVMDYTRFNYVAQPGDGAATIGKIGPYDKFAIEWGYKPVAGAYRPEDEKVALDLIAARQVSHPELRYDGDIANILGIDPTAQTEDVGDDPVEAARLGLLNIRRIAKNLVPATTGYGEDYDLLADVYSALLGQRAQELNHVVRLVGGVVTTDYHAGRGQNVYAPVPAAKQAQAVHFLVDALKVPSELLSPDILNKVTPAGATNIVSRMNSLVLYGLFSGARIRRMSDNEAVNGAKAYTPAELVADVQSGVWSELSESKPSIDPYCRATQRSYLDMMDTRINGDGATGSDLQAIGRYELKSLAKTIDKAIPRCADAETAMHLEGCRRQIEKILEGKNEQIDRSAVALSAIFDGESAQSANDCWTDPVADGFRDLIRQESGR